MEAGPVPSTPQRWGATPPASRPSTAWPTVRGGLLGQGRASLPCVRVLECHYRTPARSLSGTNSFCCFLQPPARAAAAAGDPEGHAGLSRALLLSSPGPGYTAGHTGPSLGANCRGRAGPPGPLQSHLLTSRVGPREGAALMMPLMMCSWPTVILFH